MNIILILLLFSCMIIFSTHDVFGEEDDILQVRLIQEPSSPIPTILAVLGTLGTLAGLTYAVYRGTEESKLSRGTRERETKHAFTSIRDFKNSII